MRLLVLGSSDEHRIISVPFFYGYQLFQKANNQPFIALGWLLMGKSSRVPVKLPVETTMSMLSQPKGTCKEGRNCSSDLRLQSLLQDRLQDRVRITHGG